MIVVLAILSTLIVGVLGAGLSHEWMDGFRRSIAITTMGGFILYVTKKNSKSSPPE